MKILFVYLSTKNALIHYIELNPEWWKLDNELSTEKWTVY